MQTEPGQMNMEMNASHSDEWHKEYILNMQKNVRSMYNICINDVITERMIKEADGIYEMYMKNISKTGKKFRAFREKMMDQLRPLFDIQPQFEKICQYRNNKFVDSCFTKFDFKRPEDDKSLNDSKFVINFCGYNLTELSIRQYPHSEIMPLISDNCPSLKKLLIEFEVIESHNFESAFSRMCHLENLTIKWLCENSTLPLTLVSSLKQVGGTLKELYLDSKYDSFLPDSLALVFPQLIALNRLIVHGFRLSESLIQSLDKLINLTMLQLGSLSLNSHSVIDNQINMFPTGLKNLQVLCIGWEYNVTEEFFINLCNNSKQLQHLSIVGKNITNDGIVALNNLSQLEYFEIGLKCFGADTLEIKNELITDQSVTTLSIEKLWNLDISNCTKISNKSVIGLVENLDNLRLLIVQNTMVSIEIIEELSKLKKCRSEVLFIWVSFEDSNGIFKSLSESHNIILDSPK